MRISIDDSLRPTVEGKLIETAPSVSELHALLGPPSRIGVPKIPAPVGYRNNQLHIYESDGICFYEHHYTRRIFGLLILFSPEEHKEFDLNRSSPFTGTLDIAGQELSPTSELRDFFQACPVKFEPVPVLKFLRAEKGEFSVILGIRGPKLESGGRSKVLRLVDVSLDWEHDNWGEPAIAD